MSSTSFTVPSSRHRPTGTWILGGALLMLSLVYVVLAAQDRFALQRAQSDCAGLVGQMLPDGKMAPSAAPHVAVVAVHPAPVDLLLGPQLCTLKFNEVGRVQHATIVLGR